jgi:hypothetical protein
MTIGDHPALAGLHKLDLRSRGIIGSFHTDGYRIIDTSPFDVGPSLTPAARPASSPPVQGRHLVTHPDGSERTVDAQLDGLGLNPGGEFVASASGYAHRTEDL